jgi:hypothetical protein
LGSGAYEASKDWGEHNLRGAVLDNEKGTYKIFQEMLATGEGGEGGGGGTGKKSCNHIIFHNTFAQISNCNVQSTFLITFLKKTSTKS